MDVYLTPEFDHGRICRLVQWDGTNTRRVASLAGGNLFPADIVSETETELVLSVTDSTTEKMVRLREHNRTLLLTIPINGFLSNPYVDGYPAAFPQTTLAELQQLGVAQEIPE